ncbi:primase alpha helix C-terminal domain-containing protein [Sporosarcina sp. USHLN248]|uniref:primase alpha helix C-terminal domain-containing protein n=1 Tax=Sporosarcina sp. USHLN248 TaxID=3081300 RepID=UPI0038B511A1
MDRNPAAASLADHLLRKYVDPGLVHELLKLWNLQNSPPLSDYELNKIVHSITKKEFSRRNQVITSQGGAGIER